MSCACRVRLLSVKYSVSRLVLATRPLSHFELVKRAELEVGYATSFLGLKYIVSEEFSTIASYVKQLVQTKHPLIDTVRNLLAGNRDENQPSRSLLILLLCKLAAETDKHERLTDSRLGPEESGLFQVQRDIAEMAEMMFVGFSIHATIQNLRGSEEKLLHSSETVRGNKLAVLIGDFILAKVSKGAADTESSEVVTEISLAVGEASEGNFRRNQCSAFVNMDKLSRDDLIKTERIHNLSLVSPFARFVRSALLVSGHGDACIDRVTTLSKSLISCLEGTRDLSEKKRSSNSYDLLSKLTPYRSRYENTAASQNDQSHAYEKFASEALDILSTFPECSTKDIIYDLIKSYK